MKILIKGYFGFGNFGDDILLIVAHSIVKEIFPTAEIFVYSNNTPNNSFFALPVNYNNYIFSLINDVSVKVIDWTFIGEFDIVFNGGGGLYFDYFDGGLKYSFINRLADFFSAEALYNLEQVTRRMLSKNSNQLFTKRYGLGIGIEKFHRRAPGYVRKKSDLGSYSGLIVRDATSLNNLYQIGYKGAKHSSSDSVFLSRYWLPSNFINVKQRKEPKQIGFVLMDWENFEDEFAVVTNVADQLKQQGFEITFFSFDKNHDKKFIERFSLQPFCTIVVWEPEKIMMTDFLDAFNQQDLLITARAHGAIIGGILGIPSLCLGIREKLETIHEMFRLSSRFIRIPFNEATLYEAINAMLENYTQRIEYVKDDVKRNEEMASVGLVCFKRMISV